MKGKSKILSLLLVLALLAAPLLGQSGPSAVYAAKVDGGDKIAYEVASEGEVLLKNSNDVLPIKPDQTVSVFGRVQINTNIGGSGSGSAGSGSSVNILDSLRERGKIQINEELAEIYEEWCTDNPTAQLDSGSIGNTGAIKSFPEMPLTQDIVDKAASKSDLAIVVIGRVAGEGGDRHQEAGDYYLSGVEKTMLKKVTDAFEKVVVVLNVCGVMDMNWIDTYGVDSVLFALIPGRDAGAYPIADVLSGEVNPSGKLVDTIAVNYIDYPSAQKYGETNPAYREDIYTGYRYFETFNVPVKYEFGFGMSYTDFKQEITGFSADRNTVTTTVKVTNTGDVAGKEVVQVYYSAPQGFLGKPAKELAAYAKTELLQPGEYQSITISYNTNEMSSYDDAGKVAKSAYVLEAGNYNIYAGNSIKNLAKAGTYTLSATRKTQQLSEQMAAQTEDSTNAWKRLTADGTYENVPTRTVPLSGIVYDKPAEIPYTGDKGKKLFDVYNGSTTMDEFIAQLPNDDLIQLTSGLGMSMQFPAGSGCAPGAAGGFGYLPSWGIPGVTVADGPIGLSISATTTRFPIATLMACTWNEKLLEKVGDMVGKEMVLNGVDIWLAPGMNLHRDPFCGRNYEYFSEDPVISGTAAAAIIRGVQANGVGVTPKHFAVNNQETERHTSNSRLSERALREIYLKGFEIVVKTSDPWCIMTSYNLINGSQAPCNYELNTNVLRKEWGFTGTAMSDWFSRRDNGEGSMIRAQNDLHMPGGAYNPSSLKADLAAGTVTRGEIQRSVKNTLNTVMKSLAFGKLNRLKDNGAYEAPDSYFTAVSSGKNQIAQTITLNQATALIEKNSTLKLTATAAFSNSRIEWNSSDPSVASVNAGLVSANKAGTTIITASVNGLSATCSITVRDTQAEYEKAKRELEAALNKVSSQDSQKVKELEKKVAEAKKALDKVNASNKSVSLRSVKSSKKKQITVKWKKVSSVNGYQIQYSLKKNFKSAKNITISKNTTISKTIKKLKSKKVYYVKIRPYTNIDGKKVYGKYSSVKKVRVK